MVEKRKPKFPKHWGKHPNPYRRAANRDTDYLL